MKTDDDYAEQDAYMRMQDTKVLSEARVSASTRIIKLGDAVQNISKLYWASTLPFGVQEDKSLRRELLNLTEIALEWAHELDERPEAA